MQTLVRDESIRSRILELSPADVPATTSVLRRLDVILWMEGGGRISSIA